VGDLGDGARTHFLHVFEITDESARQPSDVRLVRPAGVDIGDRWQVRFNAAGVIGGSLGGRDFTSTVNVGGQYR
jgi:hypothetical protein